MQIVINVPEKEFSTEIEDRFQDFFKRLEIETKEHMIYGTNLLCGAYELETIDMFLKAFKNAAPLPRHGRLYILPEGQHGRLYINNMPALLKADKDG